MADSKLAKAARAARDSGGAKASRDAAEQDKTPPTSQGGRETVESIVIAVILAFLFRTFVAEAFVIPTGSMAPTLQGRHIDVACAACDYRYRTGASDENERPDLHVREVACPNCGLPRELQWEGTFSNERSFNGDRILVSKFSYDLYEPDRWDVIVFKFPGNAKQNYIKRLVGLPGELLKVWRGNVYAAPVLLVTDDLSSKQTLEQGEVDASLREAFRDAGVELGAEPMVPPIPDVATITLEMHGGWTRRISDGDNQFIVAEHEGRLHVYRDDFQILRKPPRKLLAMLQVVHDSKYTPDLLHEAGWPLRWQGPEGWTSDDNGMTYQAEGVGEQPAWLRYRHTMATGYDWRDVVDGRPTSIEPDRPGELITDYYAYNYRKQRLFHWVGDLGLEAKVESLDGQGAVHLDLVRAGRHYTCRFDLETGEATLTIDGGEGEFIGEDGQPRRQLKASTKVQGKGTYKLRMTNADDQVHVWVGSHLLEFDGPTTYQPTIDDAPMWSEDDPGDTEPAGIGAEGAKLSVLRLKVLRDVYYIADDGLSGDQDFDSGSLNPRDPRHWQNGTLFASRRALLFVLGEEQYFPMGDNSPFSQDARRWSSVPSRHTPTHYVEEKLLTGKALLIYWPHHWRWPPLLPNFQRMGLIR